MRNDEWLSEKMYYLWENHFVDVPRLNKVIIKFGKRSKRQLGCIGWLYKSTKRIEVLLKTQGQADNSKTTLINITSYFKDESIPEEVIVGTIAHEMCHYAHGFNSPLNQIYNHPHKGGLIRKELVNRGLEDVYKYSKKWIKSNWHDYLKNNTK